jgi:hypothetical protein
MAEKAYYFYRNGMVRKLKPGTTPAQVEAYKVRHPNARQVRKPPTLAQLERWELEGVCYAPCGCRVDPDGECAIHGLPSWLVVGGYI